MPASILRISFAADPHGELISPADAIKDYNYFCPACGAKLVFRRGERKIAHFAHKADGNCSQESITHKTAKMLVMEMIRRWKAGEGPAPVLVRKCQWCSSPVEQSVPGKVNRALDEVRTKEGFVVDVALLSVGGIEAAVEIRVTHAVDERKATHISVPYIEVLGEAILDDPLHWTSIADTFNLIECKSCKQNYTAFRQACEAIAHQTGIRLPLSYYRYAPTRCYRCHKPILAFDWPDREGPYARPDVQPMPPTIRYKYSYTVGDKYWANTCHYCQALQGDHFLHYEYDGPFAGFMYTCGEDTSSDFERDLHHLANSYAAVAR